jgi:phosphoribosyl-ATP pyrophosphohydrolase
MTQTINEQHILDHLFHVIKERQTQCPEGSYTTELFQKGTAKIAQKVGEEAVETVIEALRHDKNLLINESADLLYHLLVLWADQGVSTDEIWQELKRRHSVE